MSKVTAQLSVTIEHVDGSSSTYTQKVGRHEGDNPLFFREVSARVVADVSAQVVEAIGADFAARAERRAAR